VTAVRDEDFDLPVTIATEQTGQFLTVTRTAQAADFCSSDGRKTSAAANTGQRFWHWWM
jgi:hypothetical protein